MKIGNFEKIKSNKDDFYLIEELDRERKIFRVMEVIYPKVEGEKFRLIDSMLGTKKEDIGEDEPHIFGNGRSKSKFKNAIEVYKYYGLRYLNVEVRDFNKETFLYEELYERYDLTAHDVTEGKLSKNHEKLRETLIDDSGVKVIDGRDFINYGSLVEFNNKKTVRFIFDLLSMVKRESITEAQWGISNEGRRLVIKVKDKHIILYGLSFGDYSKESKFTEFTLEVLGFKKASVVLSDKNGKLVK